MAATGGREPESSGGRKINVSRVCTPALKHFEVMDMSEETTNEGFASVFEELGQFKAKSTYAETLEAYLLEPLPQLLGVTVIPDEETLAKEYGAFATRLLQDKEARFNLNELGEKAMELFKRFFVGKVCELEEFSVEFLNAADAAAAETAVALSSQQDNYANEYNDFKTMIGEQISDLVEEQTKFLCKCRGLNGLGELSDSLHLTLNRVRQGKTAFVQDTSVFVQRFIAALAILDKHVPADTLVMPMFKEHFVKMTNYFKMVFEKKESPEFQRLLRTLMRRALERMWAEGKGALAAELLQKFLEEFAMIHLAKRQRYESVKQFYALYFGDEPDFGWPEDPTSKKFNLAQLRVFEYFAVELQASERMLKDLASRLEGLLDVQDLLERWQPSFMLHSAENFLMDKVADPLLVRASNDLIDRFVVRFHKSVDPHTFAVEFDQFLDSLLTNPKFSHADIYFLKLVNGLGLFSNFPETTYEITLPGDVDPEFIRQLQVSWQWAQLVPDIEERANKSGRKVPAALFSEYVRFSANAVANTLGLGEMQYNKIGGQDFEAGVAGDLNSLKLDKRNKNKDVDESGPKKPKTQTELADFEVARTTLQTDCSETTTSETKKIEGTSKVFEQKYFLVAEPEKEVSLGEFQKAKSACEEAKKAAMLPKDVTYVVTSKTLLEDCSVESKEESVTVSPDKVVDIALFFFRAEGKDTSINVDQFHAKKHECENPPMTQITQKFIGEDCARREQIVTRKAQKDESAEQTIYLFENMSGPKQISQEEYEKLAYACDHPPVFLYTTWTISECQVTSEELESTLKPVKDSDLRKYVHKVAGQLTEVSQEAFERLKEDCSRPKAPEIKTHLVNALKGQLSPETLKALRDSPDMIAFMQNNAAVEVEINGELVEVAFVQLDRENSACYKGSAF